MNQEELYNSIKRARFYLSNTSGEFNSEDSINLLLCRNAQEYVSTTWGGDRNTSQGLELLNKLGELSYILY